MLFREQQGKSQYMFSTKYFWSVADWVQECGTHKYKVATAKFLCGLSLIETSYQEPNLIWVILSSHTKQRKGRQWGLISNTQQFHTGKGEERTNVCEVKDLITSHYSTATLKEVSQQFLSPGRYIMCSYQERKLQNILKAKLK